MIRHLAMSVSYTTPPPDPAEMIPELRDEVLANWAPDARHFEYAVAMSDKNAESYVADPYGYLRLVHGIMLREAAVAIGGSPEVDDWAYRYVVEHATWEVLVPEDPEPVVLDVTPDTPKVDKVRGPRHTLVIVDEVADFGPEDFDRAAEVLEAPVAIPTACSGLVEYAVPLDPARPNTCRVWDTGCRHHWPEACGAAFIPSDEDLDLGVSRVG